MASPVAAMDFDEILKEIGEFGRYQRVNYLLICLPVLFAAANSLSYVFTAGIPKYRCHIDECEVQDQTQYQTDWLDHAIPGTRNKHGYFTPGDMCRRYAPNSTANNWQPWEHPESQWIETQECNPSLFLTEQTQRCQQFVYEIGEYTIVQEWQLTCKENTWKLAFVGTTHFAGLVIGTALFGYLADRFGRKYVFLFCTIFMGLTGIGQALAWDYISFLIFALLNAVGTSGVYPLAFIIGVEMVGPRKREMTSIVLNYFYAVGEALVGLAAWLLTDWKHLQLALSIPPLFFVIYVWLVPESVRWLLARNEHEKAGAIIRRAAHVNQRELSLELMASFKQQNLNATDKQQLSSDQEQRQIWASVKQVFGSHSLIWRYILLLFIWAVNAIVFYGLSLNSTNLSGNKYLNFALVCLIEIPGYSLAWLCLRKLGRRLALSGSLLLCAVTCAASGYMTSGQNWLIITLFLIGKLGITSSFAVIYTYTAEMMPTVIRSGGVGVMSTFARFGAMLAPFVPLLGTYYEPLPMLLFGGTSMLAGLLSLLLPETFHKKLPDTVTDAIMLGSKMKLNNENVNNCIESQQNESII
ncbi:organic cation transporter protein [Drosophila sulfurigaster albostrigata]|uniref:organic cation transporter protein n=1 Tax=Drosophila sulfurigaster albostrigata TaxID=89887 RepID=UPI002D21D158|nr:organic cation transporter protein [Drosophila sulfurigaster albostrigata]XP_062127392.1 organic cation transporter protein [Drosophila sulfurigaster albostrigata]XP_062127393.1 organic cation transporter protein [Drosophila sulfurigaster albostrigata]